MRTTLARGPLSASPSTNWTGCPTCRSSKRVPSHLVLAYGERMPVDPVIQAGSRAAGEQLDVLKDNGFESVTVLTSYGDFDRLLVYQRFLCSIFDKMKNRGVTLFQALVEYEHDAECRPIVEGSRPVGQQKLKLAEVADCLQFRQTSDVARGTQNKLHDLLEGETLGGRIFNLMQDHDCTEESRALSARNLSVLLGQEYATESLNRIRKLCRELCQKHGQHPVLKEAKVGGGWVFYLHPDCSV